MKRYGFMRELALLAHAPLASIALCFFSLATIPTLPAHALESQSVAAFANNTRVTEALNSSDSSEPSDRAAHGNHALSEVTMSALLDQRRPTASNLNWTDQNRLIARFAKAAGEPPTLWELDPTSGNPKWVPRREPCSGGGDEKPSPPCWTVTLSATKSLELRRTGSELHLSISASEPIYSGQAYAETASLFPQDVPELRSYWSKDGKYIAVERSYVRLAPEKRVPDYIDGVPIIDVAIDDRGLDFSELYIVDVESLKVVSAYSFAFKIAGVDWSRDDQVAITHVNAEENVTEIFVAKPGAFELRRIYVTKGVFVSAAPVFSPNGSQLLIAIDADNRDWAHFLSLAIVDIETGHEHRLTQSLPIQRGEYIWAPDGRTVYAPVRSGGLDGIWSFPVDRPARQLIGGHRRNYGLRLSPDGAFLAFQTEDGYGKRDIRVLNLSTGQTRNALTVDWPAKDFRLGQWMPVKWRTPGDVDINGFIFFPPDFDQSRKYPMIVDVHGGGPGSRLYLHAPFSQGTVRGPLEWHAWAALGYIVFVPDYRTSGDYGPDVLAKRRASGVFDGVADAQDVISGVEWMTSHPFIDPQRIGLIGHSAGGRRVFMALHERGDLFAAAIINDAIPPDPRSFSESFMTGPGAGSTKAMGMLSMHLGAPLRDSPDRYRADYLFDIKRFRTPTLILMGDGKRGMAHLPYQILLSVLKNIGVPSRMLVFPDEGHVYRDPRTAKVAFDEARLWFERFLQATAE